MFMVYIHVCVFLLERICLLVSYSSCMARARSARASTCASILLSMVCTHHMLQSLRSILRAYKASRFYHRNGSGRSRGHVSLGLTICPHLSLTSKPVFSVLVKRTGSASERLVEKVRLR